MDGQGTGRGAPRTIVAGLILAVLILATYGNSFSAGFVLDNKAIILDPPQIHVASWENLTTIFTHRYWWPSAADDPAYRPLTTLSYLFNYAVLGNGDHPGGYHALNLVLHWLNALLVYLLARRLTGSGWTSLLAASLFAVHPITTEAVTNIIGRADLLATASVLSGLLLYIRGQRRSSGIATTALLAVVVFAGLLSKETAATIVGLVLIYQLLLARDVGMRLLATCLALAVPLAVAWAARHWVGRDAVSWPTQFTENVMAFADPSTARLTALQVIGSQILQIIWPARLCCDYSVAETTLFDYHATNWVVVLLACVTAATILPLSLYRRSRVAAFYLGTFWITLLPTSNLLILIASSRADRFLYLPLVGATGLIAVLLQVVQQRWLRAGTVIAILVLALRTHARNDDWRDGLTLSGHDVQACSNSFRLHQWHALELFRGDKNNLDQAIAEAERAQQILDGQLRGSFPPPSALNLGQLYFEKARTAGTEERREWLAKAADALKVSVTWQQATDAEYRRIASQSGNAPESIQSVGILTDYQTLARAELELGQGDEAISVLQRARRLAPNSAVNNEILASVYEARNDDQNAIVSLLLTFICDGTRKDVWPRLQRLFERVEPNNCAFSIGNHLNPVRPHRRTPALAVRMRDRGIV